LGENINRKIEEVPLWQGETDEHSVYQNGLLLSPTTISPENSPYGQLNTRIVSISLQSRTRIGEPLMDWIDLPFNQVLEQEIQEWNKFRRTLRKEDQQIFDQFFEKARLHVEAGGSAGRQWPFETTLISFLLEQEKALAELRSKIRICEGQERERES
jgi:hypothetical protein